MWILIIVISIVSISIIYIFNSVKKLEEKLERKKDDNMAANITQ